MRYSVTLLASDRSLPMTELASMVEDRGLDGLWLPDHSHTPVGRGDTQEDHSRHERMLDPIVGLALAAAVTTRVRLGTGVLLAAQRDPIATAKALATLDQQSAGRLVVGVGSGWNRAEMRDHGVEPRDRRERLREHLAVMRALWEQEVAEHHGTYVDLGPSTAWPKPLQRPLPVLLGAAPSDRSFDLIAAAGQGWIPRGGSGLGPAIARLRASVSRAGGDQSRLEVVCFSSGDRDHEKLDHLAAGGATEVAFDVPLESPAAARSALDALGAFIAERRDRLVSRTARTADHPTR